MGVPLIACSLAGGGVSERPKERASKARVGATSPWVQIPPPPPSFFPTTLQLLFGSRKVPIRAVSRPEEQLNG